MKFIKEKKGFTLIELLAVIVVLAIIMVLATSTVLPLIGRVRKNAFADEATSFVDAASNAMSLIQMGQLVSNNNKNFITQSGTVVENSKNVNYVYYCFTLKQLKAQALFDKDDSLYKGIVIVQVKNNALTPTYRAKLYNNQFYVDKIGTSFKDTDTKDLGSEEVVNECPTTFDALKSAYTGS